MTAIRAQRFLRSLSVIASVVVLAAAFAGWAYYQHLNGNLHRGDLNLGDHRLPAPTPNAAGQTPLNILVIGTDSRGTAANVRLGGARNDAGRPGLADVEMLVHVAADRGSMTVLSIPRDTRVTIPACTDPATGKRYPQTEDIINASLQNGGPGCTVATWEQLTGIPVDHFMMADFSGVVNLADAIGGVPVCVDHNINDPESGLRLPQGTSYVQGQQALQWLRTRHGFEDGSDIGRTHAQHLYMSAMIRQLKKGAKLSDPAELMVLAEQATKALTVDTDLASVDKLYNLANDLKRVPTDHITMATMPWTQDPQNADHVVPSADATTVFEMIRDDVALDGGSAKASASPAGHASQAPSPTATGAAGAGTAEGAAVPGAAAPTSAAILNGSDATACMKVNVSGGYTW